MPTKKDETIVNNENANNNNEIVFNEVDSQAILKERLADLLASGKATTSTAKIDNAGEFIPRNNDDFDDEVRTKYSVTFGGVRGVAYLYPQQVERLLPFAIDGENANHVKAVLKMSVSAEIVVADIKQGDTFRYNLHSDKEYTAEKDLRIVYVVSINYKQTTKQKIEDTVIAGIFGV